MSKLEDIPKKQIFNVPENYFDELPAHIQSRIAAEKPAVTSRPVLRYALQYALPLALVIAILFYYDRSAPDAASILASVETNDLIEYLQESEMTTEDLLDDIEFTGADLEAIENEIYDSGLRDADLDLELNTL